MLKIKVMSKKHTSLGIKQQYDFSEVLYILKTNENTLSEINDNLLEVSSTIQRYHHAENRGYFKKTHGPRN